MTLGCVADLELSQVVGNALGTGGAVGALVLILWRLCKAIFDRFIASQDALAKAVMEHTRVDIEHHAAVKANQATSVALVTAAIVDHTKTDLAHHAEVRASIERMDSKIDTIVDWRERTPVTPIEVPIVTETPSERRRRIQRTNPQGYRPPRPGTRDGNDD